ncbi:MAG: hypothetical protein AB7I27_16685 [Bacteriovoracaceae bacterium]
MSRLFIMLGLMLSFSAFAQDLAIQGFQKRFLLSRSADGTLQTIRMRKALTRFSIRPFIDQIKSDLTREQASFHSLTEEDKAQEIDNMLYEAGLDPYAKGGESAEEAKKIKESLLNIKNINIEDAFAKLEAKDFWKEFEERLNQAFLMIDPTIVANLNDAKFFYRRQVTYKVVNWALEQAEKRFSAVPILNIASFVIVRVHDMMLEQRLYHQNMLLHYFDIIGEEKLGMTKEEVDRAVSSIYESRIDMINIRESNKAAADWLNYGMNNFYEVVRSGNERVRMWQESVSDNSKTITKLDFAFAEVAGSQGKRIYHLHVNAHSFTKSPALAYDYNAPMRVKRNRALLNLAHVALGFIQIPGWIKGNISNFIKSFYVDQVRYEGALVAYFESIDNKSMVDKIFDQRANFYILK